MLKVTCTLRRMWHCEFVSHLFLLHTNALLGPLFMRRLLPTPFHRKICSDMRASSYEIYEEIPCHCVFIFKCNLYDRNKSFEFAMVYHLPTLENKWHNDNTMKQNCSYVMLKIKDRHFFGLHPWTVVPNLCHIFRRTLFGSGNRFPLL